MKGFITLAAPEVFHDENSLNVGIYGLEGSKPGAAACGVLLSHEVKKWIIQNNSLTFSLTLIV